MVRGLIFDFDGLILDTETPEFEVWQEIFGKYELSLPLNEWQAALGASFAAFDPVVYLSQKTGLELDHKGIHTYHRQRALEFIYRQPPQPGLMEILDQAKEMNLRLGIASSSPVSWVEPLLDHLKIKQLFDRIICKDHVQKIKPDPELFLRCAGELGLERHEAIVFEDSPNGILAARAAGIFCVAIPNSLTSQLDLSRADLIQLRLDQIPLQQLFLKATLKPKN